MKCRNCGKDNPPNSKYCTNCGSDLETQGNIPVKEKNNTTLIITIGLIIIIILIAIFGIAIYGLVSDEAKENQTTPVILNINGTENTSTHHSSSGSWHKVGTYDGVSSDMISVTTKGSRFKVTSTAMPIKNYATNYLYTSVISSGGSVGSSDLDWGSTSAVATKSKTLEFTGSGTHSISIDAYELQWWTVEVWEYY